MRFRSRSDLNRSESLDVGGNQLTSLNVPEGLTHLARFLFINNPLTNITLPPAFNYARRWPFSLSVLSNDPAADTHAGVHHAS